MGAQSQLAPDFLPTPGEQQGHNVAIMGDLDTIVFGSLLFLGVVFVLGLLVNVPVAVIYCRSRQIRGFTDKFILFVLIVDVISLLVFIPVSFLYVVEYGVSLGAAAKGVEGLDALSKSGKRPVFLDENQQDKMDIAGGAAADANFESSYNQDDSTFSSFCVQQWILIIHKLVFIVITNLCVLGALKIAMERYLAVVAPLHYHKILKSSVIFFVSLFSFVFSLACAVVTVLDPTDFPGAFLLGKHCTSKIFRRSWSDEQMAAVPVQFDSEQASKLVIEENGEDDDILQSLPEAAFVPHQPSLPHEDWTVLSSTSSLWWWPVLKLIHAAVFFVVPITVILYMYLRIMTEARKQNRRMSYRTKSSFILPPPTEASGDDAKKPVGFNVEGLHQVLGKFKLVQRLKRKTRVDRAARVAFLTIGLSVICFGPLFYVQIVSAVTYLTKSHLSSSIPWVTGRSLPQSPEEIHFAQFLLPTLLACLHPVLSPLVYVYRYKRVRKELRTLLQKLISSCCCCHSQDSASVSSADCQEVVRQFNQMAQQRLPATPKAQPQQNSKVTVLQCDSRNNTAISIDRYYDDEIGTPEPVAPDSGHYLFCASSPSSSSCSQAPGKVFLCEDLEDCDDDDDDDDLVIRATQRTADLSDMENQPEREHQRVISVVGKPNGFFNFLNDWMSSYSRRWNQHRDSVTSTASFITLLSNRSRSIPADSAAVADI